MAAILAMVFSGCVLWLLGLTDPKRRRVSGQTAATDRVPRKALVLLALLPGLVLMLLGDWSGFVIWLGGSPLIGWAIACGLAARTA